MFGSLGPMEILLIFIIALLVFGPRKLPEIGRSVGKAIREFKRTSDEIKGRIEDEIQASEIGDLRQDLRQAEKEIRTAAKGIQDTVAQSAEEARGAVDAAARDAAGTGTKSSADATSAADNPCSAETMTKDTDKHDLPEEGPQDS